MRDVSSTRGLQCVSAWLWLPVSVVKNFWRQVRQRSHITKNQMHTLLSGDAAPAKGDILLDVVGCQPRRKGRLSMLLQHLRSTDEWDAFSTWGTAVQRSWTFSEQQTCSASACAYSAMRSNEFVCASRNAKATTCVLCYVSMTTLPTSQTWGIIRWESDDFTAPAKKGHRGIVSKLRA